MSRLGYLLLAAVTLFVGMVGTLAALGTLDPTSPPILDADWSIRDRLVIVAAVPASCALALGLFSFLRLLDARWRAIPALAMAAMTAVIAAIPPGASLAALATTTPLTAPVVLAATAILLAIIGLVAAA